MRLKARWSPAIRVIFSAAFVALLILQVGSGELLAVLLEVDWISLSAPLALLLMDAGVRSANWRLLLRAQGVAVSPGWVFYSYVSGGFVGAFVPSTLGTDAARALVLCRGYAIGGVVAIGSIVALNVMGFLAVCTFALSGVVVLLRPGVGSSAVPWVVGSALTFLVLFSSAVVRRRDRVPVQNAPVDGHAFSSFAARVIQKCKAFCDSLRAYQRCPSVLMQSWLLSMSSQIIGITVVYILAHALNLSIPFSYICALVPIIALLQILPLSVLGFGAEQGVFVYLFHQAGVPAAEALSLSLTKSGIMVVFLVICGGVSALGVGSASQRRKAVSTYGSSEGPRMLDEHFSGAAQERG